MTDSLRFHGKTLNGPVNHFLVTPSDADALPYLVRGIRSNGTGTIAVRDTKGTTVSYEVNPGDIIPVLATHVLTTGTTVASIVGWY